MRQPEPTQGEPRSRTRSRPIGPARAQRYSEEEKAILGAAYRQLTLGDGPTISVVDVIRETGLSNRAFYRQFESKDHLVLHMCRLEFAKMSIRMAQAVARAKSPLKAVEAWIDEALAAGYDPRRARRAGVVTTPDARAATGYRKMVVEGQSIQREILAEVIRGGKRTGDFPDARPEDDARAIQAVVNDLIEARLHGEPGPSREAARAHLSDMFSRSVGASGRKGARGTS